MIPILYSTSETSFTSNGLGRLTDCISCLVTEERNGIFECEFQYPITGKLYNEMVTNGGIISVTHDDAKDRQPFDIYKYSAPIDGIVTFNARHISYRLSGITVKPFTAASCALALQGIGTNSLSTNPFSFWTDKAVTSTFTLSVPTSAKAILAGQQGSILDVYGKGEYKFDKFDVKLYTNRGTNSGVTIRYGKNLSDTLVEKDNGEYYNAIVPYWKGEDGTLVTLTGWYVVQTGETLKYCVPVDFSSEFQSQPTEIELRTKAAAYLANNTPWLPKENIKVDFVQLWNTDEYKNVAVLERVKLCDTVAIYYPALGLTNSNAKAIKVVYDTLLERYTSIELGEPQQTLAEAIMQPYAQAIASISDKASVSFMEEAIQAATDLITGGLGGHVVINRNANGEPEEILIMDTDDTSTAVNVWRWNLNGLAHSHSGYNGPFDDIAITQDGKINASMITAGTLSANRISGGTIDASDVTITNLNASNITSGELSADRINGGRLTVGGQNNVNGAIIIKNADGNQSGSISNLGVSITAYDSNRLAMQMGRYQNGGAFLIGYGSNGLPTVEIDSQYGKLSLRDANLIRRVEMSGDTGFFALRDKNNANLIIVHSDPDQADFGSQFDGPVTMNGTVTMNSVLDVTPRRCYAALSSRGWYRVFNVTAGLGRAGSSFTITLHIGRAYDNANNELHTVTLLANYNNQKFSSEVSNSNSLGITKVRYTADGSNNGHIDIYYDLTAENYVYVDFDVHCRPEHSYLIRYNAVTPTFVAASPSGETVLTEYTFAANTMQQSVTIPSSQFSSGNGTIWGSESNVKLVWDNKKVVMTGFIFIRNPAVGVLYVDFPTPTGFPYDKFNGNWLIVGQAYRRADGYMQPGDFVYGVVNSSVIRIAERNVFTYHPATDYAMITIPSAVYYF